MSAAVHQIAHHQRRSPQLENGYTRIATELLEALSAADLTRREFKVALAILRKTYGFRKKADDVSASQLGMVCHMPANHVSEALNALKDKNVIFKRKGRHGHIIGIQKDYSLWPMDDMPKAYLKRKEEVVEEDFSEESSPTMGLGDEYETAEILPLPVPQPDCPSPATGLKTSPTVGHTIDNSIDNSQKIKPMSPKATKKGVTYSDDFLNFYQAYPRHEAKKPATIAFVKALESTSLETIMEGVARAVIKYRGKKKQFIPLPSTWLNEERWTDELEAEYSAAEMVVIQAYNEALADVCGHIDPAVFSADRAALIRDFMTLSNKPEFWLTYFPWVAKRADLPPNAGFDYLIGRDGFSKVKGGQFTKQK